MDAETPATESIEASLKSVASTRKRGGRKPKTVRPVRVDAADLPIDGDVSMEMDVENVPDGFVPIWLTQNDQGRFRRRPLVPVKWGNEWGCQPAFAGEGKEGTPIVVKELTLFLEPKDFHDARMTREARRLEHAKNMATMRRTVRSNGITAKFASREQEVLLPASPEG